jgi:hypothetical protein
VTGHLIILLLIAIYFFKSNWIQFFIKIFNLIKKLVGIWIIAFLLIDCLCRIQHFRFICLRFILLCYRNWIWFSHFYLFIFNNCYYYYYKINYNNNHFQIHHYKSIKFIIMSYKQKICRKSFSESKCWLIKIRISQVRFILLS